MSELSNKLPILPDEGLSSCRDFASIVAGDTSTVNLDMQRSSSGNVAMITLGCAKNTVDSEVMLGVLVNKGFRVVGDLKSADLIVVNTCGFLHEAVEEGIDRILEAADCKRNARCKKLVVAGCMVERYRQDLERSIPEVDRFISTDEILTVGDDVGTSQSCFDQARRPYFVYDETMPRIVSTGSHSAYVKISEGCNRPCAFCIIPKIRGNLRSRSKDSVIREVENLLVAGVSEINLVAQDITAYGSDWGKKKSSGSELASLIRELDKFGGDYWIRLLYAYPLGVSKALLSSIFESSHIARYLDLPLQHISDAVLKRMCRPLGERGTRDLINEIRGCAPQVALRTTFILGFPGETWDDVVILGDFIAEGHFAHVGVFKYSQEEEAESFSFDGQIDEKEKEERISYILEIQKTVVAKRLSTYIGRCEKVLIDGRHSETDLLYVSRAEWQAPETDGEIIINDITLNDDSLTSEQISEQIVGKFANVKISEVSAYDLIAELVDVC